MYAEEPFYPSGDNLYLTTAEAAVRRRGSPVSRQTKPSPAGRSSVPRSARRSLAAAACANRDRRL